MRVAASERSPRETSQSRGRVSEEDFASSGLFEMSEDRINPFGHARKLVGPIDSCLCISICTKDYGRACGHALSVEDDPELSLLYLENGSTHIDGASRYRFASIGDVEWHRHGRQ